MRSSLTEALITAVVWLITTLWTPETLIAALLVVVSVHHC